ncbi:Nucleotidyl transferase [uncultured archaeon]|nr:Nucleotidyl transferase [uncultured archaeon]
MVQKAKLNQKIAVVYMCAGMSSRFGGKIKQFAEVGKKGETLMEVSMQQAIKAGFNEIIFIVGEKTEEPFKDKFKAGYLNTPVFYAKQTFDPAERDRPWGTVDALVSAKGVITSSFVVCNGDDLYGEKSFKIMHDFLLKSASEDECATMGYELGNVLSKQGGVNRAKYLLDAKKNVIGLEEIFDIKKENMTQKEINEKTAVSMNLFGLKEKTLELLEQRLIDYKKKNAGDRRLECYLPNELGALAKDKKITLKLLHTKDKWLGITNPGDEVAVRKELLG